METTAPNIIRFNVQSVDISNKIKKPIDDTKLLAAWGTLGKIEASSSLPEHSVEAFDKNNLLASAVHTAFYEHYPLRLSPDVIWLTIAQGLCNHVNQNAEALRSRFVTFEGKKDITVSRPGFVKGSPNNDWPNVFPEFSDKIAANIGTEKRDLIECRFSTTTPVERIVSQIALMDTVKAYFNYRMVCGCGIPFIELTGTVEDWVSIRERAESLKEFDLEWWINDLVPILDQFVEAAKGNADTNFWKSICNLYGGSGMRRPITGWIQTFFPYVIAYNRNEGRCDALERNKYLGEWKKSIESNSTDDLDGGFRSGSGCGNGVDLKRIPSGISTAPFTYLDLMTNTSYSMSFNGGLVAIV